MGVVVRDERLVALVARLTALVALAATAGLVLTSCSNGAEPDAGADTSTPHDTAGDTDGVVTTTTTPATDTDAGQADGGLVADPVALDAPAEFGNGVTARLAAIDSVTVEGGLPGERGGPGVAITVEITNDSAAPIDLDLVLVDLVDAAGASASPITKGASPVSGELAVGATASGRYLFTIALEDRADATVRVSYTAEVPTVLFTGSLPGA